MEPDHHYFRRRAAEERAAAAVIDDQEARTDLLALAQRYDDAAETLELLSRKLNS